MIAFLIRIHLTSGEHVDIGPSTYDTAEKIFNTFQEAMKSGATSVDIGHDKEKFFFKYENIIAMEIVPIEV